MLEKFDIFFFETFFEISRPSAAIFEEGSRSDAGRAGGGRAKPRPRPRSAALASTRGLSFAALASPRGARAAATARGPVGHPRLPLVLFLLFLFPG